MSCWSVNKELAMTLDFLRGDLQPFSAEEQKLQKQAQAEHGLSSSGAYLYALLARLSHHARQAEQSLRANAAVSRISNPRIEASANSVRRTALRAEASSVALCQASRRVRNASAALQQARQALDNAGPQTGGLLGLLQRLMNWRSGPALRRRRLAVAARTQGLRRAEQHLLLVTRQAAALLEPPACMYLVATQPAPPASGMFRPIESALNNAVTV
jgi:hypothetical protein